MCAGWIATSTPSPAKSRQPRAVSLEREGRLSAGFARAGHAHLRSQLTRAADSIATNIVEGCGAATRKELARFLDISIKSANETEYHLLKARDHNLILPDDWNRFTAETIEVRKMIFGYRKQVLEHDLD